MIHGPYLPHDPVGLTLCANLAQQYDEKAIDSVWQLRLEANGPITVNTSFGLRTQSFQIFPVFMINKVGYRKINEFLSPPQIRRLWQNHIQLWQTPSPECSASFDLWVSSPEVLEGRISLKNTGNTANELGARVAARLFAFDNKDGMNHTKRKSLTYLKGESDGLQISVIMDGMLKPIISPELALENTKVLGPNESLNIFWRCKVSEGSKPEDDRYFTIFPVNWDAEMARLALKQQTQEVSITTPNVDWDIAFRMSQLQAQQLITHTSTENEDLSLITTRNPHSRSLEPLKLNNSANSDSAKMNALKLWQAIQALLPANTETCANLFESYLEKSLKPNPQNGDVALAFPILCQTAWLIHSHLQEKDFLQRVYPQLRTTLFAWFWQQNDRDQDSLPEWSNLNQTGMMELDSYDLFKLDNYATPISTVETVGLAALLHKECQTLNLMAKVLEDPQTEKVLGTLIAKLSLRMKEFRDSNILSRDRDSHQAHSSELYFEGLAKNLPEKGLTLTPASRLNIKIKPSLQIKKPQGIRLLGTDANGHPVDEALAAEQILWLPGSFLYCSHTIFSHLEALAGYFDADTEISIYRAELKQPDISHLLAWDPNMPFPVLDDVIEQWLMSNEENSLYGLPEQLDQDEPNTRQKTSNIAWNALLLQHVLLLGEREMAFRLFNQMIRATISVLRQEHAIFERVNSKTGQAYGKANDIRGLLPTSLFMDLLGIKIYSPTKVSVGGTNAVPWPVTVRYMGLEITRDQKNSTIIMPDGSSHHHFGSSTKTFVMDELET